MLIRTTANVAPTPTLSLYNAVMMRLKDRDRIVSIYSIDSHPPVPEPGISVVINIQQECWYTILLKQL